MKTFVLAAFMSIASSAAFGLASARTDENCSEEQQMWINAYYKNPGSHGSCNFYCTNVAEQNGIGSSLCLQCLVKEMCFSTDVEGYKDFVAFLGRQVPENDCQEASKLGPREFTMELAMRCSVAFLGIEAVTIVHISTNHSFHSSGSLATVVEQQAASRG